MKKHFCLLLFTFAQYMLAIPPEFIKSYIPEALLEALAKKTDWPEIGVEHPYAHVRHMSFSFDNKYVVLSDGNSTQHIRVKRLLNPEYYESYSAIFWSYLRSYLSSDPIQVATQPENQEPQNEYIKKCFLEYKKKELIEKIICTRNGSFFLVKEKTEHLEKSRIKLLNMQDFSRFAQEMAHDYRYRRLLQKIENYFIKNEFWHIETDERAFALFSEFPEQIKEVLRDLALPR